MPRIKLQANKLENPKVSHISLVDHGANRIPFRIIKRQGMIDLTRLLKRDATDPVKKAESTGKVLGVVVEKTDKLEKVAEVIKAAGFSVDTPMVSGGTVVYTQGEAEINEATSKVIKMSQDVLAILDEDTAEKLLKSSDIAESMMTEHGFLPSISMAARAMHDQLLEATEAGEDVVQKAEQIIDSFKSYALTALELVPTALYQADLSVEQVMKAEAPVEDPEPKDQVKEPEPEPVVAKEDKPVVPKDPPVVEAPKDSELTGLLSAIEKMGSTFSEKLDTVQKTLQQSLTDVTGQVDELRKANELVSNHLQEVEKVAKATESVMSSTVVAAPPPGDDFGTKTQKSQDDDPRTGTFDTAFLVRKTGHSARNTR